MKAMCLWIAAVAMLLGWTSWADGCSAKAGGTCAASATVAPKATETGTINPAGLAALLESGAPVLVLDARSGKYDDGRRIGSAKSLTDKASAEEVAKVVPTKESLVVAYCSNTKCQAGPRLAKHLQSLGYSNVLEMPAGIDGWVAEGRPVQAVK